MTLYVDTSVWFAAANGADSWHSRAREILEAGEALLTSDHVLLESWSLLRRRLHHEAAECFWEGLRSGVARIEIVGAADLETAWSIGRLFPDQFFSVVDRTSFALMERLGVCASSELRRGLRHLPLRPQARPRVRGHPLA